MKIPPGYCRCGCGGKTNTPTKTNHSNGRIKGVPMKFIRGHYGRGLMKIPDDVRFWSKVDKSAGPDACWPYTEYINENGYGQFYINRRQIIASRAAFMFANNCAIDGLVIRHECDNPICCNPAHLVLGTQTENMADMDAKGRRPTPAQKRDQMFAAGFYGEKCAHSTIPAATVSAMRELFATGKYRPDALSVMFGVSKSQTWRIVLNKTRVHG